MARSPLTLAATVTSALPRVVVTGVGSLSEGTSGRYDSAIAELDDGRRVVVRVPVDDGADADLVVFDPDAEPRKLTCRVVDGMALLTLPKLHVYQVVVVAGCASTLLPRPSNT